MNGQSASRLLVVVQAKATQFDGPFFRYLTNEGSFRLEVYFTSSPDAVQPFDPELGLRPDWNQDVISGYSFHVFPDGLYGRIRTSSEIFSKRPDLIILSGWRSFDNLLVLFLAHLLGVPVGIRADNCELVQAGGGVKRRLRCFVRNRLLGLFTTGHPVGTLSGAYMTEGGMDPSRLFPFPYLVDQAFLTQHHSLAQATRNRLRAIHGISPQDFVVLGVMKFVEREDPITLLRAFSLLDRRQTGVHLILVGDGPLRESIEQFLLAEKLGNVTLPGYAPYRSLPDFFAEADVLVHTARQESWGVTVNEALVCGLPVLAADTVGSSVDLIEAGVNGFVFPCGDAATLGSLLERLRLEPLLLESLKGGCQESARLQRFTYASTLESLNGALHAASGRES